MQLDNRAEAIEGALELLTDELEVELSAAKKRAIADYLNRNIVPEGAAKPARTRVPKETVETIRAEYAAMQAAGRTSMTKLAAEHGLSVSTVQRYVAGTLRK